jgi:hypothetical protein
MSLRRFSGIVLAALLFAALPIAAQQILPHSLDHWTGVPVVGVPYRPAAVTGVIPVAPPQVILTEYGWTGTESVAYSSGAPGIAERLQATVFKMKDPSGAYGLYSFLITADLKAANYTEHSSISAGRALILIGNLVLDIEGTELAKLDPQIKSLVATVQPHAQTGPLPGLWQHLPSKGFVARSNHYILGPQTLNQLFPVALGDSLGFAKGAEAELGHYKVGDHDAVVLIADFPTPGIAMQQLSELQKQFNINGSRPDSLAPPLYAKRTLTLVAIAYGAPSQAEANALLDQVHSGTEITWNEPTFQFKEPSIEMMVAGSIIGAGIICGFALVAGFAFGGFRLFVKRLLPGKVFDRTSQVQVLQLGLSSKPINAEDFYASVGTVSGSTTVDKNLPDRIALRIFR